MTTKQEFTEAGKQAGQAAWDKLSETWRATLLDDRTDERQQANVFASAAVCDLPRRSRMNDFFFEAFVKAFLAARQVAYDAQPHVKAVNAEKKFNRRIDEWIADADRTLQAFRNRLDEGGLDAMKWNGEDTIRDEAKRHVATSMREIAKKHDMTTAVNYAKKEALRSVRFPQRSTSPLSNYVEQEIGSAFAAFCEGEW
jgi:hypothetical protein